MCRIEVDSTCVRLARLAVTWSVPPLTVVPNSEHCFGNYHRSGGCGECACEFTKVWGGGERVGRGKMRTCIHELGVLTCLLCLCAWLGLLVKVNTQCVSILSTVETVIVSICVADRAVM